MKRMEIDKLVRWAIVDELPKGRPVTATAWDRLISYGRLGTRIDTSAYGTGGGMGIVPGTPHPDAEKLATAIGALPESAQLLEEDCAGLLGHYAALSMATVRQCASHQRYNLRSLMVRNAILDLPDFDIDPPRPEPLRYAVNGKVIVHSVCDGELAEARAHPKHGGYHHLTSPQCLLDWSSRSIQRILIARAEFAIWHVGLGMLVDALVGTLEEHVATATSLPSRPWLAQTSRAPRVFRVKAPAKLARLPLKPERAHASSPRRPARRNDVERQPAR